MRLVHEGAQHIDDIERIMAVMEGAFNPQFREAWTRRQVEDALLIGNCHYFLSFADHNGGETQSDNARPVSGFALSRASYREEELLLIAVLPEYRGQGFGESLLIRLLDAARGRGADRLLLEMRRGNPAESLYRKQGFQPVGIRPDYYRTQDGDRIDAITFARELR